MEIRGLAAVVVSILIWYTITLASVVLEADDATAFALHYIRSMLFVTFIVVIIIPNLVNIMLFAGRLQVEWSRSTFLDIWVIHVAVVVAPLLLARLERWHEAQLLVVPVVALAVLVHATGHVGPEERAWRRGWWWHIQRTMLQWTVAILLAGGAGILNVRLPLRVRSVAALWSCRSVTRAVWEILNVTGVVPHHFHVVPLEHLHKVRWQLAKAWHSW